MIKEAMPHWGGGTVQNGSIGPAPSITSLAGNTGLIGALTGK